MTALLIVEGNPQHTWQSRMDIGGVPYHQRFKMMLDRLGYNNVEVAFPVEGNNLPSTEKLVDFDGILLTGSSLNIYSPEAEVTNQLAFAEHCFNSGVPVYGSCWGLQVAVVVAGGKVERGENGREFGAAKAIQLTQAGKDSRYFSNKPAVFDAFCIHEDETTILPKTAEVLAYNAHSQVQALTLTHGKSEFFGVQYHPEFVWDDLAFLAQIMQEKLTNEGIFNHQTSKEGFLEALRQNLQVNDFQQHTLEVANWLNALSLKNA